MNLLVLDTNIIVSAAIVQGSIPDKIVQSAIKANHVVTVVTPAIVTEYRRVVMYKKFSRYSFPPKWLSKFIQLSHLSGDPPPWPLALPDPTDEIFLAAAKATGAWLITGNMKHYPEEMRDGVVVMSPTEYVKSIGLGS